MERKKTDRRDERRILTHMVVSTQYLREIAPVFSADLLEVSFAQTVADWCTGYLEQYGEAPGQHIEDLYHSWARKTPDEDMKKLLGDFLASLSREWERAETLNVQYALDKAREYLAGQKLKHLREDIGAALTDGEVSEAEHMIEQFKGVSNPRTVGVNPFTDAAAIQGAFERRQNLLFTFPGALGQQVNEFMSRESLVGIMGREKIGKTWWLTEMVLRAVQFRRNVAYFQCGDMTLDQILIRIHVRLAGKSNRQRYTGTFPVPHLDCAYQQDGSCRSENRACQRYLDMNIEDPLARSYKSPRGYKPCVHCEDEPTRFKPAVWYRDETVEEVLTHEEALTIGERWDRRMRGNELKLSVHPTKTLTVQEMDNILDGWEAREGFTPDVIVVDYADIMTADRKLDPRHQENAKWEGLRRISQERHALVIAATQADAESYNARTLQLKHFTEDKRKYSHVTGLLTLNQVPEEKRLGLMRVGILLAREEDFDPMRTVTVMGCLRRGRPVLGSYW